MRKTGLGVAAILVESPLRTAASAASLSFSDMRMGCFSFSVAAGHNEARQKNFNTIIHINPLPEAMASSPVSGLCGVPVFCTRASQSW